MNRLCERHFDIPSYLVDPGRRLGLTGLLSLLQETAWVHAEELGHGYEAMLARERLWVVARLTLRMPAWPAWGDRLTIRTWLRPPHPATVLRDFEFWRGSERLGEATVMWVTIHTGSRRPVAVELPSACGLDRSLDLEPPRLTPQDGLVERARYRIRPSDLDMNGHVNHVRYAQWILDSGPTALTGYSVNFLAECGMGQEVSIEAGGSGHFQGRRPEDGRVLFVARLDQDLSDARRTHSM